MDLNKFKLSKEQMNVITGGNQVYCQNTDGSGDFTISDMSVEDAYTLAESIYGKGKAVCEEVLMP